MNFYIKALLKREWLLAIRQLHDLLQPVWFLLILAILFPLAINVQASLLERVAPGVLWLAILLSMLLSCEKCYREDFEDGSLEQILLAGNSLLLFVLSKAVIHWLVQIMPLMFALPILALFYGLSWGVELQLALTLLLGSPPLLLLGMLGAAITLSTKRGSLLLVLLILPLCIPTLIFSLMAVSSYLDGFSNQGQLSILLALLMLAVTSVPFAIVAALKANLSEY